MTICSFHLHLLFDLEGGRGRFTFPTFHGPKKKKSERTNVSLRAHTHTRATTPPWSTRPFRLCIKQRRNSRGLSILRRCLSQTRGEHHLRGASRVVEAMVSAWGEARRGTGRGEQSKSWRGLTRLLCRWGNRSGHKRRLLRSGYDGREYEWRYGCGPSANPRCAPGAFFFSYGERKYSCVCMTYPRKV